MTKARPPGVVELPPGFDPVHMMPRGDIERWVQVCLAPLGGIQVWAYAVIDYTQNGYIAGASIQVDVRASSKSASFTRADAARRVVMALPTRRWDEGVISRTEVIDGPFWLPDQDGRPRYVARYLLVFHPRRAARPPAVEDGEGEEDS
jgi:hypothetical protein